MTEDENYLRAVEFRRPEWIPCNVNIMPGTWQKYREAVEEIVLRHPALFGGYQKGDHDFDDLPQTYRRGRWTDEWGCEWLNVQDGMMGQVVGHPLADDGALADYQPPDPLADTDWDELQRAFDEHRKRGDLARGWAGSLFHQLCFLRGFENLMLDFATDSATGRRLIEIVTGHVMPKTEKLLAIGATVVCFGDDLGISDRLPMSPEHFRKYLGPSYARIFGACRNAGAHVYLHTDGHIVPILADLIDCGVTILNPEDAPNGLPAIATECKGKVCVDLTVAQQYMPFMSRQEIFKYFEDIVTTLGSEEGGLILYVEIDPDVPLENIDTIFEAVETCRRHAS